MESRIKALTESIILDNAKSVHLVEALKLFGGWHSQPEGAPDPLSRGLNFHRAVMPKHKLAGHEFLRTVLHKKMHGGHIVKVLVDLGVATEEEIVVELTKYYKFPYLPLTYYDINPEAIKAIPEAMAKEYLFVPLDKVSDNLMISMVNPLDKNAILEVERQSNCFVQVFVSTLSDIQLALEQNYKNNFEFLNNSEQILK
jgi:hypothetical protein